jgi:signal transduction histidine kinase
MQGGLFFYDPQKDDFSRYTDKTTGNQIFSNVMDMEYDEQGNLWVVSIGGLAKLDREGNLISMYGSEMGLNTEDFHILATIKGRKGQLYIGDNNGFFTVLPQENKLNLNPPQIVFTDIRLLDEPVKPEGTASLAAPIGLSESIKLAYNQNVFALDFSGIHFTNPSLNRHMYMLENYDENWREAKSELTASYFKVPPGEYLFRVKAASSEGIWAEKVVTIIIQPPWWATWWAYGIYALLLSSIIFIVFRTQRRRIIRREREWAREKELVQAKEIEKAYTELKTTQAQLVQKEKMASLGELTAGIAHEIQNPLNFVNNFSEANTELLAELKQEAQAGNTDNLISLAEDIEKNQHKITHHGRRADSIVKGMLQHARISTGKRESVDLNKLVDEYLRLSYQGLRAKDKAFHATLQTHYDESLGNIQAIPQDLGRVLLNLYNNAFYAVSEKKTNLSGTFEPTVLVSTMKEGNKVLITVKDNGTGMSQHTINKAFQPFFTTKPTGEGTGLGLSLSYDVITKGHGGNLSVQSREGEVSEFVVQLPAM